VLYSSKQSEESLNFLRFLAPLGIGSKKVRIDSKKVDKLIAQITRQNFGTALVYVEIIFCGVLKLFNY
jgi:hypothetical protein